MPNVKVFVMIKDEPDILPAHVKWHAYLFGMNNLYYADNFSTDKKTKALLKSYSSKGLNVRFNVSAFKDKGNYLREWAREVFPTSQFNLMIPLDVDEFVVVAKEDRMLPVNISLSAQKELIWQELNRLSPQYGAYQFRFWLTGRNTQLQYHNILREQQYFSLPRGKTEAEFQGAIYRHQRKRFFNLEKTKGIDLGYHTGDFTGPLGTTRLSLLHYHFRDLSLILSKAKNVVEKIPCDVNNLAQMRRYRDSRKYSTPKINYLLQYKERGAQSFLQSKEGYFFDGLYKEIQKLLRKEQEERLKAQRVNRKITPPTRK